MPFKIRLALKKKKVFSGRQLTHADVNMSIYVVCVHRLPVCAHSKDPAFLGGKQALQAAQVTGCGTDRVLRVNIAPPPRPLATGVC